MIQFGYFVETLPTNDYKATSNGVFKDSFHKKNTFYSFPFLTDSLFPNTLRKELRQIGKGFP